ncbi:3-keto-5-aminohexanoate cleavage protein [Plantactinospora sp. GCM10030261]|uniref:3-keto-5-aminohexanoate cleavage protein n=1 Tax=Plantactinospora sp. GCM10030261 TaxID=3273420 RepID=UPI00361574C9
MLKVCLNGGRDRREHPAVPVTAAELAADAARCVAAGAAAIHLHPRGADETETLDPAAVGAALTAIRAACPGVPVGVSTGAWIVPRPEERVAAVRSWEVLPDFASVNAHEEGAEEVAAALCERGIGVEAGLWTLDAVRAYRGWRVPVLRVLLECMDPTPEAATADAEAMLAALPVGSPRVLMHAEGPAVWHVLRLAVRLGLDSRIGLEDTTDLPDGSRTPDNAALVAAAMAVGAR